ncbi:hypothetical protein TSUD_152360 [Trifolium subterraneum]|uniref:Flavonoid 3',5'-hydroxylase n=1 Tax=Trifolium subterraneum TaxID=3900 RepID=A0A2Z6MKJ5_TRISU|nr:hypothetical protein TSUD_152360 [Trifolium subterraneum]
MNYDLFLLRDIGISLFIFLISYFSIGLIFKVTSKNLPPGPKGWPILGVLPHLGTMPHVTLANMAKKFGPIMYLKMGTCDTIVASSPNAARAFLKTLDHNFLNRPTIIGATHLGYNSQDLVFAKYGPKWKLLRKLTTLHMLGGKALQNWSNVREKEVKNMVRSIHEFGIKCEPIEIGDLLSCAITNMVSEVVLSKRIFANKGQESKEFKEMVVEFMTISGVNIGDFIPFIGWMDLGGVVSKMKCLHKKFDVFLTKMIEDHVKCAHERKEKPNFLDILMANGDDDDFGTDTSSSIIEWALAEMLRNPHILLRAQKEIDQVVGKGRMLVESDLQKLPYLQAICKETYRLHPSTPLSVPRVSNKACQINGYYIPKDTRFNVNIWAIGRDPDIWANPLEFNPERFLSGKNARIDLNGVDFELIPFGAGRRICVGYRMAIVVIEYILGTLVHSFDWKLPIGVELNMDEAFGLTLQKAVPLSAMVIPRLVSNVYV